jgi:hypothetical protein
MKKSHLAAAHVLFLTLLYAQAVSGVPKKAKICWSNRAVRGTSKGKQTSRQSFGEKRLIPSEQIAGLVLPLEIG